MARVSFEILPHRIHKNELNVAVSIGHIMVMESLSAWLELYNPFIGEHSTTIFTVVRHSVTLLRSVKLEYIGNPRGTMLHCNAPTATVSFRHAAGRPGIAVYLRRVFRLSDVCEHIRIGALVNSALAVQKHPVPVNSSSFLLLHEDVLSVVHIFFVRNFLFLDSCVHLVLLLFI